MDYNQKKPLFFRLIVYMSSLLTMTTQMMACRAKAEHLNVLAAAMDLQGFLLIRPDSSANKAYILHTRSPRAGNMAS